MERSRTAPPASFADHGVASLPEGLPPLKVLIQQVRVPGADLAEVDALLSSLSQPLAPEHSPRERADLLLSLLEDPSLADFTGSSGHTVRGAAVEALMALGFPYALELPPEALDQREAAREARADSLFSSSRRVTGLSIIGVIGLLQLVPVSFDESPSRWVVLGIIVGITLLPALLTVLGHNLGISPLRWVGIVWLMIAGLFVALAGSAVTSFSIASLVPLVLGGLIFYGAWLMNSKT